MALLEPIWVVRDSSSHGIYNEICQFMQSARIRDTKQLADLTALRITSHIPDRPSEEEYRHEIETIYGVLLSIVRQIDGSLSNQDHLIQLTLALRALPLPRSVRDELAEGSLESFLSTDLFDLRKVWSDIAKDAPLYPPLENRLLLLGQPLMLPSERPPWRLGWRRYMTGT